MTRVAWYAGLVLATLVVLALLWQFGAAVMFFLLSLAIEAAFHPLVEAFQQRGVRRGLAVALSYGIPLAVLAVVVVLASGPFIENLQKATDDLLISYEQVKSLWQQQPSPLLNSLSTQMPPSQVLYTSIVGDQSRLALQTLFGAAEGTLGFVSGLVLVMVLSVYWSIGHVQFERLWLSLLPVEGRARARTIWLSVQTRVGAYLRREATLSLLAWILLWLGFSLLGIKYAALLAVIGALARLIPWLGSFLVVFLPLLVGSVIGWWAGPVASVYTLISLAVLEITLGNTIFPPRRYSSLLLVLFMIAMIDSYGLAGAIFAPILTVTLHSLFDILVVAHSYRTGEASAQSLLNLQEKMENIRGLAGSLDEPNAFETTSLTTRLAGLLERTTSVVKKTD